MNCSRMLAAIGFALDLSGALLLWKYGLPESLSRDGSINLICEQQDQAEVAKHGGTTAGLLLLCA
jgi:hypothetical protein